MIWQSKKIGRDVPSSLSVYRCIVFSGTVRLGVPIVGMLVSGLWGYLVKRILVHCSWAQCVINGLSRFIVCFIVGDSGPRSWVMFSRLLRSWCLSVFSSRIEVM